MNRRSMSCVMAALVIGACGSSRVPSVEHDAGSGFDAGPIDAAMSDASIDDASVVDGTPDTGTDSGRPALDGDGDGVEASLDCDDADPAVGTNAARPCDATCGSGIERCSAGVWGACEGSTDCFCTTPGATRIGPCQRCGTQAQRCSEMGIWVATGACNGQGECEPGEIRTTVGANCRVTEVACNTSCRFFGPSIEIVPAGECFRGDRIYCPDEDPEWRTCSDDCQIEECAG